MIKKGAIIKKKDKDEYLQDLLFQQPVFSTNVLDSHIFPDKDIAKSVIKGNDNVADCEVLPIKISY